jgi:hypothetical protein
MSEPSSRTIENLIRSYAWNTDNGEFDKLGELLGDADFVRNDSAPFHSAEQVEQYARDTLMTYEDGTPHTRHITTNVIIEVADDDQSATSRSYYTVLQSLTDFALQVIATGRYTDRFARINGEWRFTARTVTSGYFGDVSHHIRRAAGTGVGSGA